MTWEIWHSHYSENATKTYRNCLNTEGMFMMLLMFWILIQPKTSTLLLEILGKQAVIFTCVTNLKCLSDQIKEIFIDCTFKCCPNFFLQLYTIHGCENGNCVSLVFVLLPSKTEICYDQMWDMLHYMCREREV